MRILRYLSLCSLVFLLLSCDKPVEPEAEPLESSKIRVILDTDANNELDDQHAIAYLLLNGDVFDVEGITVNRTSNGGDIDEQYAEAVRIVKLCDVYPDMKVLKGASTSYQEIKDHLQEPDFDGAEAVNFMIERAHADEDRTLVLLAVGKITNVALALAKDPTIAGHVRVVWLAANYPNYGEYNLVNDTTAVNPMMTFDVPFEIAIVRYGQPSGTAAVTATMDEIRSIMPGKGPHVSIPVTGRHGGSFTNFGDYSVNLFEVTGQDERALYDMAAAAIVKDQTWAQRVEIGAPLLLEGQWIDRPDNPRKIIIWENFDKVKIMEDFYESMTEYVIAQPVLR